MVVFADVGPPEMPDLSDVLTELSKAHEQCVEARSKYHSASPEWFMLRVMVLDLESCMHRMEAWEAKRAGSAVGTEGSGG